jgi:hypothetical protein
MLHSSSSHVITLRRTQEFTFHSNPDIAAVTQAQAAVQSKTTVSPDFVPGVSVHLGTAFVFRIGVSASRVGK